MTADPWGIVVVPTEEGRALTDVGPALLIPPGLNLDDRGVVMTRRGYPPAILHRERRDGLPLRWAGALVPEGWDRARRVWWASRREERVNKDAARAAFLEFPAVYDVACLARALESAGMGRVVLLDLVDGAVRERAP